MLAYETLWWHEMVLYDRRTDGPFKWDCIEIGTYGCALLTAVLFSWA